MADREPTQTASPVWQRGEERITERLVMSRAFDDVVQHTEAIMREQLIEVYLDWRNNYLSVELFAEHHGLTDKQATVLIELAREVFNSKHPEA